MARVSKEFSERYTPFAASELVKPIVFVVDMVNGFVMEGALHDIKINDITKPIQEMIEGADHRVIFVSDTHPPRTREFLSYPSHCVIGTQESEIIEELKPYAYEIMHKNSTNTFTCPDFQVFLEERMMAYQDIVIVGCCSDICIMQFALCLNAWLNEHNEDEKRIMIPINCIDTYHIEGIHDVVSSNEFSIRNMEANGIWIASHIEKGL